MKYFVKVVETKKGFKVMLFDGGYINMCEFVNGSWRDCIFPNKEEAEKAGHDYDAIWKD